MYGQLPPSLFPIVCWPWLGPQTKCATYPSALRLQLINTPCWAVPHPPEHGGVHAESMLIPDGLTVDHCSQCVPHAPETVWTPKAPPDPQLSLWLKL